MTVAPASTNTDPDWSAKFAAVPSLGPFSSPYGPVTEAFTNCGAPTTAFTSDVGTVVRLYE